MRRTILAAAWVIIVVLTEPQVAVATPITYNFSGTTFTSFNGSNSITGQFTLDTSGTGTITAFDFTEPAGTFDGSNATASVFTYTPALVPNADFVQLGFLDKTSSNNFLSLVFETTLSSFDENTLAVGFVTVSPGVFIESGLSCLVADAACSAPTQLVLISGGAPAVPEPTTVTLVAIGLAGLVRRYRRGGCRERQIVGVLSVNRC